MAILSQNFIHRYQPYTEGKMLEMSWKLRFASSQEGLRKHGNNFATSIAPKTTLGDSILVPGLGTIVMTGMYVFLIP